jgi:hypothetical protein
MTRNQSGSTIAVLLIAVAFLVGQVTERLVAAQSGHRPGQGKSPIDTSQQSPATASKPQQWEYRVLTYPLTYTPDHATQRRRSGRRDDLERDIAQLANEGFVVDNIVVSAAPFGDNRFNGEFALWSTSEIIVLLKRERK